MKPFPHRNVLGEVPQTVGLRLDWIGFFKGKFVEAVAPTTYTFPLESIATLSTTSFSLPPRYVENFITEAAATMSAVDARIKVKITAKTFLRSMMLNSSRGSGHCASAVFVKSFNLFYRKTNFWWY